MPITQNDIQKLKNLLEQNQIAELFEELDKLKIADLRLERLKNEFILGKTDVDFFDRLRVFINELLEKGLETQKKGEILYQIPTAMQIDKASKCIIRIAISQEALIKGLKLTSDIHLDTIRLAKIMEVGLVEPPFEQNFEIRLVSQPEQVIDFEIDEFTEWLFYVKPLHEGNHTLLLKVAVIEVINQKERKKEIVLEKEVNVVAEFDFMPEIEEKKEKIFILSTNNSNKGLSETEKIRLLQMLDEMNKNEKVSYSKDSILSWIKYIVNISLAESLRTIMNFFKN